MTDSNIYKDIVQRCGGKLNIGVVGPVRTGKTTFINRFKEELAQPGSNGGEEVAAAHFIECAGFPTDSAEVAAAAKLTGAEAQKSIESEADFGILVTCDGSFTDTPRSAYAAAEGSAAEALKASGKPYIIVLNTSTPFGEGEQALAKSLKDKYNAPVLAFNCQTAAGEDFNKVLRAALFGFPVTGIDFKIPEWLRVMPKESSAISELIAAAREASANISSLEDCSALENVFANSRYWKSEVGLNISTATGMAEVEAEIKDGVLFEMLSEISGEEIGSETALMQYISSASAAKRGYDKLKDAFECAKTTGYGIVRPTDEDLNLEKPELVKQGSNLGIKLKASAPSYHVVRVDVNGEVSPIMGQAAQSEDMVNGIMSGFESDPSATWNTSLFGKSLKSMVKEGLDSKVVSMQDDTRSKMRKAITRIVNEGRGGVICIIL